MRSSQNVVLSWFARRHCKRLLLLLTTAILFGFQASSARGRDAVECVPGEIIVKLERSSQHPSYALHMLETEAAKCGLKLRTLEPLFPRLRMLGMGLERIYLVNYDATTSPEEVAARYATLEGVSYASPNWLLEYAMLPDDPGFFRQYYLDNTGQCINPPLCSIQGTMDADVDAPEAWDLLGEATNPVVIGIVDTGTLPTHEDLIGQLWVNPEESEGNGRDDDENGFVDDVNGWNFETGSAAIVDVSLSSHGTRVSGIIGAQANNGVGIAGICPQASLMTVVIGSGETFPIAAAVQGIVYAVDNGARIVNMSWGSRIDFAVVRDGIAYAATNGVVLVAAAGNFNTNEIIWPAAYPEVIGVAGTDWDDKKAEISSYGSWVDLSAPGQSLYSTRANGGYAYSTGTSFAAPVVVGVAALLLAYEPSLERQRVFDLLLSTADPLDALNPGFEGLLGAGRVNSERALLALTSVTGAGTRAPRKEPGGLALKVVGGSPSTGPVRLAFSVPPGLEYSVRVFDLRGRQVRYLIRDEFDAGAAGSLTWDGRDADGTPVGSGVYFCLLEAGLDAVTVPIAITR